MSNRYKQNNKLLESIYSNTDVDINSGWLTDNQKFTMSDYSFQGNDDVEFIKNGNYNKGTWGKQITTPKYQKNNECLPFVDNTTTPVLLGRTKGFTWFPANSESETNSDHTHMRLLGSLDYGKKCTIYYDDATKEIIINFDGTTSKIKAHPYVRICVQAKGSSGTAFTASGGGGGTNSGGFSSGGGGGGSGAFVHLSSNLKYYNKENPFQITQTNIPENEEVSHMSISYGKIVKAYSGNTSSSGGAGGRIEYTSTTNEILTDPDVENQVCIIDAIAGLKGGSGGGKWGSSSIHGSQSGSWDKEIIETYKVGLNIIKGNGTNILVSTNSIKEEQSKVTSTGQGGYGAPSLMSDGNGGADAIGCGGNGGDNWGEDGTPSSKNGIWISYIPFL